MLSSMLLSSSSSAGLESILLCSPGSPRFSVAGRISYSASPSRSFFQSPPALPQPESDIGLQSPRTLSRLSNARVTYSDLLASSQSFDWSSTPKLGAGPRVPVQPNTAGGKSSIGRGATSSQRRLVAARKNISGGRCASISQVSSPSLSLHSNSDEGVEICPIDIFSQEAGVGLGLCLPTPLTLADVPRSTDECTIIPITEVAPGSLSAPAQPTSSPEYSPSPSDSAHPLRSPPPSAEPTRRPSLLHPALKATVADVPRHALAAPADVNKNKYAGLGHGLPSTMRAGPRERLPSIPEELPGVPVKRTQHAAAKPGLGPSALRSASAPPLSTSSSSSAFSKAQLPAPVRRLQSAVHELFDTRRFVKRPLLPIPEAVSREASAEGRKMNVEENPKGKGNISQAGQQQQQAQRKSSKRSATAPAVSHMSAAMLLAAESILQEDKKYRKKAGLEKRAANEAMTPTMRLVHEAGEEIRKQEGAVAAEGKKHKFKFLF